MKVRADRLSSAFRLRAPTSALVLWVAPLLFAQQAPPPAQPSPQAEPADQAPPLPPPGARLTPNQLDGLVAPIALYPDPLVSQVLVASTYPKEVTLAVQWVNQHRDLTGKALADAAQEESWDPSIKALIPFVSVLRRLNQDKVWTTNLGNAFLAQQADVMQAIQRMRRAAKAAGKLSNTRQIKVIETTDSGDTIIDIEPARPDVIFVPAYNPAWIWGPAVWYPYPRWFWGPPPPAGIWFGYGPAIAVGGYFGPGWGGWGAWGWRPGWANNTVVVNNVFVNNASGVAGTATATGGAAPRVGSTAPVASAPPTPGASPAGAAPAATTPASTSPTPAAPNSRGLSAPRANNPGGTTNGTATPGNQTSVWSHDPSHRQGVPYPNAEVAQRFHAPPPAAQARQQRPQGGNRGGGRANAAARRVRNPPAPRVGGRR
jgi:uncharacterized protein DUF3300